MVVKGSRTGKFGIIGNLKVLWTPPGGKEEQVGLLNNFNIFSENSHRIGRVPLTNPNIPDGKLRVIYEGDGPDKGKVFDEKIFPIDK